ncbi:putative oxidoreductase [Gordonia soli NBRC 108243]|uniref:Putative oxidoreductase n=1 Tax=Gordonia soli NBRC 108243 TaxID=1223545 RepID=M0QN13_9ACTN|nr:putative oxidoreductase [Gordonia soli NBRC 108243]
MVKEHEIARDAGLPTHRADCPELPFPVRAAVHLDEQLQIDPMPVLRALADEIRSHGGQIIEGVRVRRVSSDRNRQLVHTDNGTLSTESVVLATGTPVLDRGGYFARVHAMRSYAAAFEVDGEIPRQMYLGADEPSVSLRTVPRRDGPGDLLLVGGFGHEVGRARSEQQHVDEMLGWTDRWFPGARRVARWSAQDYESFDQLPYVGRLLPGTERLLVATGFAKWGLSNGVAAALALAGRLLGGHQEWAEPFRPWRNSELFSLPSAARANTQVGVQLFAGYTQLVRPSDPNPAEGHGVVGRHGLRPRGTCTVDGETTSVVPVCTHLLGALRWNDAEHTWDCPLHGSRFDRRGEVLEGPATRPLPTP